MDYVNLAKLALGIVAVTVFATCLAGLAVGFVDGTCYAKNAKLRLLSKLSLLPTFGFALAGFCNNEFYCLAGMFGYIAVLLHLAAKFIEFGSKGPVRHIFK